MRTVRDETFELLRHLGLTTIFGNPGSTEMPMFQNFPSDFKYVLGLQEASVVGMADGFAQARRHAALVNLHTAPGVGNAMGAISTAYHHKTPLIITAGQQVRPMFGIEPFLFSRQAVELPKPYVKWSYEPARPEEVPAAFARAYAIAMQAPRGPVFLSIPMDDWEAKAEPLPAHTSSFRLAPDPAALVPLASALRSSRRPALVTGADVDREDAWELAVLLAERTGAAVWGSPLSARAGFPEDHPQFQGYLPPAQAPIADKLKEHDLVVVLGAPIFNYYPYVPGPYIAPGTLLFHVTDDPAEAARAPVGTSILGSVALAIEALLPLIADLRDRPTATARRGVELPAPAKPLPAGYVIHELAKHLPENAVIVDEAPSVRPLVQQYLHIRKTGGFYTTGGGGLGFALPASVGVQLADPERKVVCLIGDGSSLYSVQALWTAAQYRANVTFIVLDNEEYAVLKAFGAFLKAEGVPGLDLPGKDLTAVARGLGVEASHVDTAEELSEKLRSALTNQHPTLLNVRIAQKLTPLVG